jgi:hypothetical protein
MLGGVMHIDLNKIAEKLLIALLLAIAGSVSNHLGKLSENMEQMTQSVVKLNARLEFIANDLGLTKSALSDHESRIRGLEKTK